MFLHPSMLFEIDEFDTVFNSLKFAKDGRGESVMEKSPFMIFFDCIIQSIITQFGNLSNDLLKKLKKLF